MVTFFLLALLFILLLLLNPFPAMCQIGREGEWCLLHASIGISAMHMQLLHNNEVVMFDRTDFGPSNLSLPYGRCRYDPSDNVLKNDCTAHSLLYDTGTNTFRPLMVETDTWCSSGSVLPDGTLVQTGGYNDGDHVVRTLAPCNDESCDWVEFPGYLSERRWYATNQRLPDGRIIIIGGRRQFNYEFYPRNSESSSSFWLEFLRETRDDDENNLYPFVHLLPDVNLFIFANTRAISLDYKQNRVVREFPSITVDDPRNYPSSGSSVLLPIDENEPIEAEVMVTDENPSWAMEDMPMPCVMSDMILLPTGDVVIINGAGSGTAGWEIGQNPVTRPVIYKPHGVEDIRFSVMSPATRPRMYHSSAVLLTDGRVLVGGSNPHPYYNFTGVQYPTDLSLEAYSPPYLRPEYDPIRPRIMNINESFRYMQSFWVYFHGAEVPETECRIEEYRVTAIGPSTAEIAPPGYYLLFVVHAGIPSSVLGLQDEWFISSLWAWDVNHEIEFGGVWSIVVWSRVMGNVTVREINIMKSFIKLIQSESPSNSIIPNPNSRANSTALAAAQAPHNLPPPIVGASLIMHKSLANFDLEQSPRPQ
ncbi:hypothetical protein ACSBR1_018343 [Camellia fascicularis]